MKTTKVRFKVHAQNFIRELVQGNPSGSIMVIPAKIFLGHLQSIAERATQLNDPILNGIMCELALYSVSDPECSEYDGDLSESVIEAGKRASEELKSQPA